MQFLEFNYTNRRRIYIAPDLDSAVAFILLFGGELVRDENTMQEHLRGIFKVSI